MRLGLRRALRQCQAFCWTSEQAFCRGGEHYILESSPVATASSCGAAHARCARLPPPFGSPQPAVWQQQQQQAFGLRLYSAAPEGAAEDPARQRGAGRPAGSRARRRTPARIPAAAQQSAEGSGGASGEADSSAGSSSEPSAVSRLDTSGLFTTTAFEALGDEDVGMFCELPVDLIPEAFADYYRAVAARAETVVEKGGCRGLQSQFDATGSSEVMYRETMHDLQVASSTGDAPPRVLIDGPSGSGKSVALAAQVARARAAGMVVLYVPSAFALTQDAFFSRNEDGGLDTPDVARMLLRGVMGRHSDQLDQLRAPSTDSSLAALASEGIVSNKADVSTSAAVAVINTLYSTTTVPVMIAVDDWNALYWRTGYHEWMNNKHRKRVDTAEVRLVAALRRLMEGPPPPPSDEGVAPCVRLMAAMSRGSSISESLHVPRPRDSVYEMERLDLPEAIVFMQHYVARGAVAADALPDAAAVLAAHIQTDGNPNELRRFAPLLALNF